MRFDATISLGSILSAVGWMITAIVLVSTFKQRVDILLDLHREQLKILGVDLAAHRDEDKQQFQLLGERLFDLTANVQRLIGQTEVRNKADRRVQ